MRRSNWKLKLWFLLSVVLGVIAGVIAAIIAYKRYPAAAGLFFFGVLTVVIVLMILLGVKILRIGEE